MDRAFCSWFDIVRRRAKGVDLVVRLHQARRADFRTPARASGATTTPSPGPSPRGPAGWMRALTPRCPPRSSSAKCAPGGNKKASAPPRSSSSPRCWPLSTHSRAASADLYARRWRVELFFDDLKTTLQMERLRTKSPAMVQRELLLHMIACDLLRRLIARSGGTAARTSFKGTLDRLQTWTWVIWSAPTARHATRCLAHLLASIAAAEVPVRPGRREPRAVKRRPKSYQLLTRPRHLFHEVPHRA